MVYVNPDIAGKRVGEYNTQQISWHWPGDDEWILEIVTSIIDKTILSILNAAIAGQPDPRRILWELWGCREERHSDGGLQAHNVTTIIGINTAAGWVQAGMKLNNPTLFGVIYRGQQATGTSGTQMIMPGGQMYLPVDDILPPPAEDMIDDIGDESDDDAEMRSLNPTCSLTTKTGFTKFQWKRQRRIIRQQQYLEVIWNCALSLFADYEHSVVADEDVVSLCDHNHSVNPPTMGSLANMIPTSSFPAARWVIVRMECTGWMVVQRFALWVSIFLALWRVDGWVII